MLVNNARWSENRKIVRRIVVTGKLILLSPARFGSGKGNTVTDMPILRDAKDKKPLLPGSSIAGALRAYLRERLFGYEIAEPTDGESIPQSLFGDVIEDVPENKRRSCESYLAIEDSVAETSSVEFRPGVKINSKKRLVHMVDDKGGQLYDMELLEAGTVFGLSFELDLPDEDPLQQELLKGFAIALTGLELGEIGLGARKRRGFGECKVIEWQVMDYNLKDLAHLKNWITNTPVDPATGTTIAKKLRVEETLPDKRNLFKLDAEFQLETSLMIRSGTGGEDAPDMVHLRSKRVDQITNKQKDEASPILSGTSLAGVLRARALRIANTLLDENRAKELVCEIFGPDTEDLKKQSERKQEDGSQPFASRLVVRERAVDGKIDLVQTRIRIDHFTGGTSPGALFEQQPVVGGGQSKVVISLDLREPEDSHIALLLHILKDLWTGDLSLGGESSTGRGRLKGIKADLVLLRPGKSEQKWQLTPGNQNEIHIEGNRKALVDLGGVK